jgi:hypothetical protein
MGKPQNTIGDRDYGKRLYVGKKPYFHKMHTVTDAMMDRRTRPKHSESKKPYMEDSYPDMEYSFDPWDPRFPRTPPGTPPEFPTNPGDPPILPGTDDPKKNHPDFLGCEFFPGFISPIRLTPGELGYAKLVIGLGEASIKEIYVEGPASLFQSNSPGNIAAAKRSNSWTWTVIVKAWDSAQIAAHPTYRNMEGDIPILITVKTGSYGMANEPGKPYTQGVCTALGFVQQCVDPPELVWDDTGSATTIGQNDSVAIAATGGQGPYKWIVSGSGFSLAATVTQTASNTLSSNASACGSATITVKDDCGQDAQGFVLVDTVGVWASLGNNICPICGARDGVDYGLSAWGRHYRYDGKWMCESIIEKSDNASYPTCEPCTGFCGADACDGLAPCSPCIDGPVTLEGGYYEGSVPCITELDYPYWAVCVCTGRTTGYEWRCS